MAKRVVYTALFGPHEALTPQTVATDPDTDYLCFTDDPDLQSTFWTVMYEPGLFPADPRRSQRSIKIRGHEMLKRYDQWLYIDNTVRLKVPAQEIFDDWLGDHEWAAIDLLSETLWEEFEKNLELNKDAPERINEQLSDYSAHHLEALDARGVWNGMFVRRNTEAVQRFAELWFFHVCRYSARDQLSMMVALLATGISLKKIAAPIRNSPWHDWPHRAGETRESKSHRHARSEPLRDLSEQLELSRERTAALESEVKKLRRARFFGLAGVIDTINDRRRARKRQRRQARKRTGQ